MFSWYDPQMTVAHTTLSSLMCVCVSNNTSLRLRLRLRLTAYSAIASRSSFELAKCVNF